MRSTRVPGSEGPKPADTPSVQTPVCRSLRLAEHEPLVLAADDDLVEPFHLRPVTRTYRDLSVARRYARSVRGRRGAVRPAPGQSREPRYDAVLFDLFTALLDSQPLWREV